VLLSITSNLAGELSSPKIVEIRGKEGFWRIVKTDQHIWWFQTPDNELEFMSMVTTVGYFQQSKDENGPHYTSSDFKGNVDDWAKKTADRLLSYGFKGAGAWSNKQILKYVPNTYDLNLTPSTHTPIENENWAAEMEEIIRKKISHLRDEKNLVGYYIDNELDWVKLEPHAQKYFKTLSTLIRKHDPNHLILGVRFNKRPPLSVLKASRGFVDAHSFNIYSDDAKMWKNHCREMWKTSNAPLIVSEFSFYSDINQSGNKNLKGFGGKVGSQEARAKSYEHFVLGMASTGFIIGTEWFQWNDEPPKGRGDGEDCNFGIVDVYDKPYELLIDTIKTTKEKLNKTHQSADNKQNDPVWKDDPYREIE
jgi:hypothetical protein